MQKLNNPSDPVEKWLSRLAPSSKNIQGFILKKVCKDLETTPGELLELAKTDVNNFLDTVQNYILNLNDISGKYRRLIYATITSFCMHNRIPVPKDPSFHIEGKPKTVKRITPELMRKIFMELSLRDKSIVAVLFSSLMGVGELENFNLYGWQQLRPQLETNIHPIRIEIIGRKRNYDPFYTFISQEACDLLREYLRIHGEPTEGEPIWITSEGKPIQKFHIQENWINTIRCLGLIPKKKGKIGERYGYNLHAVRSLGRTMWHRSGADLTAAEFVMGHKVDKYNYDRLFNLDPDYTKKEYLKAEPYLTILKTPTPSEETQKELDDYKKKMQEMERRLEQMETIFMKRVRVEE